MPDHHGTLILVQGLAGSGKSHLIQLLSHEFLIQENFAVSAESEKRNTEDLARELRCGRRCIVSERKYRSSAARNAFIQTVLDTVSPSPPPLIKIICFENDLDAANHNCRFRTNKTHDPTGEMHISQNKSDSRDYEIPENAIVVKIHRVAGT
jgi:hypothetical protein